jgi:hypothetical protein
VKDFWEKKGKMYLGMTKMMMPPNAGPAMGPLLDEMAKNVTVTAQGPQVVLAVELSEKNLQGLQGQGNQFQQLMGGAGAPRPVLQPQQVPPRQGMRPQRGGPPGGRRPVPQPGAK